ncbi:MAG: hypothetical protein H6Q12_14 [Bacteroidetes bacterium]|nr:hypothetical protein [Bacteroidota bacterium]
MIKKLINKWKAETPIIAKYVRNAAILIGGAIGAGYTVVPMDSMPNWIKSIAFSCAGIAFVAQFFEKKEVNK